LNALSKYDEKGFLIPDDYEEINGSILEQSGEIIRRRLEARNNIILRREMGFSNPGNAQSNLKVQIQETKKDNLDRLASKVDNPLIDSNKKKANSHGVLKNKKKKTQRNKEAAENGDESHSYKQFTKKHKDRIDENDHTDDEELIKTSKLKKKKNGRKINSSIQKKDEKLPHVKPNFSGVSEFSSRSQIQSGISRRDKGASKEDRMANKSYDHVNDYYGNETPE